MRDRREYLAKYREAHRDQINENRRAWRQAHREQLNELRRKQYAEHPEQQRLYNQRYKEKKRNERTGVE